MPSVPIEIPSLTVIVPKTCGIVPLSRSVWIAVSASAPTPRLQGVIVLKLLATPTIGLSKSASEKPTARSMARLGVRATPAVMA